MAPDSTGQQDLRTYLRILWRWKLLFLTFLVLIPVGAYLFERGQPKTYESSTLLAVKGSTPASVPIVPNNVAAVARLVTTTPIAKKAARLLKGQPANPDSLLHEVSASSDLSTGFITITAQDRDPYRAAAIVRAFAGALGRFQTAQTIGAINLQLDARIKQLRGISANDQASRASVVAQIAQLRAQLGSTGPGTQIVQPALVSTTPIGPKTRSAVEIAFVIALLLGVGAVLTAENSDRRLRTPEGLEDLTKMPLLGTVPSSAFKLEHSGIPGDVEAFQMLRASLTYFNVDRPLSSVAIISPLAADGKTTVAVGLAVAVARAGKQAVLVDADLRRPGVCTRLGIAPTAGLGAVLAGERQLTDVLLEYPVDASGDGRLLVLPASAEPLPPNPSALLSSDGMRAVLRQLEEQADLVIVDTAAALAVSDALPLLQTASGVVMIVRMNRSSRASVRRLQKVIASTHGSVLGVVATGVAPTAGGYDTYGYYAPNGNRRWGRWLPRLRRRGRRRQTSAAPRVGFRPGDSSASNHVTSPEFDSAANPAEIHRDNA